MLKRRSLLLLGAPALLLGRAARAQTAQLLPLLTGSGPSLSLNFLGGGLDPRLSFTRASGATYFDSTGTLQTAANNVPRFDHDPVTLAPRGLLIEEQRTNSIRNNTMQGAVVGSPGTAPTYWLVSAGNGVTAAIAGVGTDGGRPYMDLAVSGTPSASATVAIYFEQATQIVAAQGQTWTNSVSLKCTAGAIAANGVALFIDERTSAGAFLAQSSGTHVTPGSAWTSVANTYTLQNASTARVDGGLYLFYTSGVAISYTLRISLPQLEQGAFATSPILTSGSAATRAADVCSMPVGSWFNPAAGTLYARAIPNADTGYSNPQAVVQLYDKTTNNRLYLLREASTSYPAVVMASGGTLEVNAAIVSTVWAPGALGKIAVAASAGSQVAAFNGQTAQYAGATLPSSVSTLSIGNSGSAVQFNGWISRIRYWPRALSASELQQVTA